MKRTILLLLITICYCNILSAQWVQSQFDTHIPSISAKANIAFLHDGGMIIYHRELDRYGMYRLSRDNGKTWELKNTSFLLSNTLNTDYCWGFNAFEEDVAGNLFMTYRYRPCYDMNSMQYLLFNSKNKGENWTPETSYTTPGHLSWNTEIKKNTIESGDDVWSMQSLNNGNTAIAGISSYSQQAGKVFIYLYSNKNNSWTKKAVSVNGKEVTANILPGCRFFDELNGILFLWDKYLITSDGGDTWTAVNYPGADRVVSADASDWQNIFVSTGAKIYQFSKNATTATVVYECKGDDDVYKLVCNNTDIHMLTKNGYYLRNSNLITPLSVNNLTNQITSVYAYPDPAANEITIAAKAGLKNTTVSIYSVSGKLVDKKLCTDNAITFDIRSLASGIYFAEVQNENGQKIGYLKWTKQ